ncbi:MAG: MobA/MobL family protein [Oscillospiraceae bacterium]|nr:MobA/MobL family protein [Oscillospiraceae bacterium]
MDFFHSHTKIVSRNKGRSAVAASAYISGTKMENSRDGVTHDYTRKKHVIYTEVMLPPNAPQEYADRSLLWNSVEWNETKANAQLARSIELSLPAELNHEQNIALVRKLVQKLFIDKGMCADVAFHDKGDGNPHVHILLTMRPLTPNGKWGDKSRLEYVRDADGNRIPAKQKRRWKTRKVNTTDWDDRGNAERWRATAADAINEALREAGFTQGFVDPRSYADQGVQRIPMVHEGPDARAMEKHGIPTEIGENNREIRQQNKLLSQLEARLARLNVWAQYEKKKDELLTAQGEDVSRESLRYKLASNILASSVQPNHKDLRLCDSTGLLSIMHEYNITDAASCAAAIQQLNTELYSLRSKRKEVHDLTVELNARIDAYEKWKKYRKHYQVWEKLPEKKRGDFERSHEYELRQYRQAAAALHRWQVDGEKIDYKGWKAALDYLNKEQFMLDYQLQEMKEKVRRMEVVKRELIQENNQKRSKRYTR